MSPENGKTDEPRDLYPVNDVAHRLGVTPRKVWSLIADERIGTVKLDGRRLIPAAALAEFIAGLESQPAVHDVPAA